MRIGQRPMAYVIGHWPILICHLRGPAHCGTRGDGPYRSAVGADPPLKSSRPSGNLMERPFATGPPAFARKPVISTSVPALIVSVLQPSRIRALGAPSSKRQLVVVPSASLTSTYSHACGLVNSIFVTVPLTLTGLFTSNSAANA